MGRWWKINKWGSRDKGTLRNVGINNYSKVCSCEEKLKNNGAVVEGRIGIKRAFLKEYKYNDIFMCWW